MLKIFLVEDEIIMREGIKNKIKWESEGFIFSGEASDGELAYPMILETKPDILLTDIKMPFMDGLELSQLVKEALPDTHIIILSGYDEFDYAKRAINIGVSEYLVKPITSAALLEALHKVEKSILEEKEQKEFLETYERERMENAQLERGKLFDKIVSGTRSFSKLLEEGRKFGMDLTARRYNLMLFQIISDKNLEEYSEKFNRLAVQVESLAAEFPQILAFERGIEGWAFLVKEVDNEQIEETMERFCESLTLLFSTEGAGLEYFGGIGQPVSRLGELVTCFEEANKAFAYRYIGSKNRIVKAGEEEKNSINLELHAGSVNLKQLERSIIVDFLRTGLKNEIIHFINEYLNSVGPENVKSLMFRQYILMDIYFAVLYFTEQLGYESAAVVEAVGDFKMLPAVVSTEEESKSYLCQLFSVAIDLREKVSRQKYSGLLVDAREFIEAHYCDNEISLNMVAASVNISPNHFSTIFSQEMGSTFIEYLTELRMKRAKELLRSTSMKSSEIGFEVGYKDPHYFSYLFKKTQGCTPREYRQKS